MEKLTPAEASQMAEMAAADGASWSPSPGTVEDASSAQDGATPSGQAVSHSEPVPAPAPSAPAARAPVPADRDDGALSERELQLVAEKARAQERLELMLQAQQAAQQPARQAQQAEAPAPAPDPEIDPIGYTRHVERTMRAEIDRLQAGVQAREQREQQIAQVQQQQAALVDLVRWGQAQEAEFAKEQPDYFQATRRYQEHRAAQLRVLGVDETRIPGFLAQESMQLAARARQANQPFGKLVYQLASAAGYRPAAAGSARVQADPDALQRAVKGIRMDASPELVAKASPQARALLEMDEADFEAALAQMSRGDRRAVFGE